MRILWIVNTVFPYPAEKIGISKNVFGGWLIGLANELKKNNNIQLAIATVYNGKTIKEFNDKNIKYYLLPGKLNKIHNKKLEKYWKKIVLMFEPEIVHIHGTEYSLGVSFQNACPEIKTIVSIQGLVSVCANVYCANLKTTTILQNITLRDIIKRDTILQAKRRFYKKGKNEISSIKKANMILGRTTWDYANIKYITKSNKYFKLNEILREKFYNAKWNIENIERHSIFISQGSYPLKGLHYAIEAIYLIKKEYSDVRLYIAGNNLLKSESLRDKIKTTGYAKYIKKLIKKYELEENIIFTGLLDEKKMIERLLKTHVFALTSAIENSSNSLCEAMLIGMPCVASNTGGTMDMVEHNIEGFLYPYTEPAMLAEYISRYFESDELCIKYGEKAKEKSEKRHNRDEIKEKIVELYENIKKMENKC